MASPAPDYGRQGYKAIIASLESGVLTLLINRAKQRNTFDKSLYQDLSHVFEIADLDDRVQVIILTAEATAPAYCSGADISGGWDKLWAEEETKEGDHAHRDGGGQLAMKIYRCRKLTIAAVNGHAAGVGMTAMQLPFDIRFAWEGAKLIFPFVRRGIVPEACSTYMLPRLIGQAASNYVLLTGITLTPTSRAIAPLYQETFAAREDVYPAALKLAKDVSKNTSQLSVAYTKGLLQHPGESIEENHLFDSRAFRIMGKSNEALEGAMSFIQRRPPKFEGGVSKDLDSWYPWWKEVSTQHRKAKL